MTNRKIPDVPLLSGEELENLRKNTIEKAAWSMDDLRMMCVNLVDDIIERELWHAEWSEVIIASIRKEAMKIISRSRWLAERNHTQPLDFDTIYQERWNKIKSLAS